MEPSSTRLLSIIIPVYNEQGNLPLLYERLKNVVRSLPYAHEIIFVNDASRDASQQILEELAVADHTVRVLEFSRNFGKEMATTAGLHHARGNACIMIDADLQHPVEMLPEFVAKWEAGAEVIVGVRRSNTGEGAVKKLGSFLFYKMINAIAETKLVPNATDYRLIDRMVVDAFNRFTEKNRITRGLIDWLGFRRDYVVFTAAQRNKGEAGYSILKLFRLAFTSFVSLSLFPLRVAGYLGIFITTLSTILGVIIFFFKYIFITEWGASISGSAILAVIILFSVGIILICLGLIALYIANIHSEVINRPMYVVKKNVHL